MQVYNRYRNTRLREQYSSSSALSCFISNASSSSSPNWFPSSGNNSPAPCPCLSGQLVAKASLSYLCLSPGTELAFPTAFCWHIVCLTQNFPLLFCPWEIASGTKIFNVWKTGTSLAFLLICYTHPLDRSLKISVIFSAPGFSTYSPKAFRLPHPAHNISNCLASKGSALFFFLMKSCNVLQVYVLLGLYCVSMWLKDESFTPNLICNTKFFLHFTKNYFETEYMGISICFFLKKAFYIYTH